MSHDSIEEIGLPSSLYHDALEEHLLLDAFRDLHHAQLGTHAPAALSMAARNDLLEYARSTLDAEQYTLRCYNMLKSLGAASRQMFASFHLPLWSARLSLAARPIDSPALCCIRVPARFGVRPGLSSAIWNTVTSSARRAACVSKWPD